MLHGLQASRLGLRVTHLFFADDSMLFAKAKVSESEKVKHVLKIYEESSGQMINLDKSALYFSGNTGERQKSAIRELLGVRTTYNVSQPWQGKIASLLLDS